MHRGSLRRSDGWRARETTREMDETEVVGLRLVSEREQHPTPTKTSIQENHTQNDSIHDSMFKYVLRTYVVGSLVRYLLSNHVSNREDTNTVLSKYYSCSSFLASSSAFC